MLFSPHLIYQICQKILSDKSNANMWGNSEVESGETNP